MVPDQAFQLRGDFMIIAIGLYQGFTALDAIGPYEILTYLPDAETVLLVPGGPCAGQLAADGHPIVDWIRQAHPHTAWTTSVCTGALLLGAAGLLKGLAATTHWSAYDELAAYGAKPTEQRVVTSGRIVTGAGVSAGIDPRAQSRNVYRRTRSRADHSARHRIRSPSAIRCRCTVQGAEGNLRHGCCVPRQLSV
jgi:putative intracellular protease/amidase